MQSPNIKHEKSSKLCKCHCCLNPLLIFPNTLDHQNSANITNSSTFQYDFATATTSSLYPNTQFTNHESLPSLQQSFRSFTQSFPQYLNTVEADQIRAIEYRNLSISSHVCLDYNGHALFSFNQQRDKETVEHGREHEFVASSSLAAPLKPRSGLMASFEVSHKTRETSNESEFESKLKERIMRYLNVLEDEYFLFFTANQTSAFGVLAELYPFQSNRKLVTVYDHENEAVENMIKCSKSRGARVSAAEFKWPKLKINSKKLEEIINKNSKNKNKMDKGLFVFPVQSKVSGAIYSYQWMNMARENGWHVLLDATSLGPKDMDTLGLSLFQPDFLICTFYKVFGEDPSGFACLLVKKSSPSVLDHSIISSTTGIVSLIRTQNKDIRTDNKTSGHQSENLSEKENKVEIDEECGIECMGLEHMDSLGLALIGTRARCLVNWLTNALLALCHPHSQEGLQVVQIYGPRVKLERGPALAFNVFDWKGEKVDPLLVQKLADRNNISLGYGYLKHLWFSERYEVERNKVLGKGNKEGDVKKSKGKKKGKFESGIAVVTATLGYLTNFEDVYKVWEFVSKFLDADFVEKERWRYTALNQKTIEI